MDLLAVPGAGGSGWWHFTAILPQGKEITAGPQAIQLYVFLNTLFPGQVGLPQDDSSLRGRSDGGGGTRDGSGTGH